MLSSRFLLELIRYLVKLEIDLRFCSPHGIVKGLFLGSSTRFDNQKFIAFFTQLISSSQ